MSKQIARLRNLITITHAHGLRLAADLRKHPSAAKRQLLVTLEALNTERRGLLARLTSHTGRVTTVSAGGVNLIKSFEGFSATIYKDSVGVPTVGYGHTENVHPGSTWIPGQKQPGRLTQVEATRLLQRDLDRKYAPPVAALNLPLTQNQFDAVVSLTYNLGVGIVAASHDIGRLLRAHDWKRAADSFLEYDHAGGQVLTGLKRRREAERALFLKP